MIEKFKWWLFRKLLSGFIGDRYNHVYRLERILIYMKIIVRKNFPEDNLANSYWHLRKALDDAFYDYEYLQIKKKEPN